MMNKVVPKSILIDKLISIRQNNEPMYRGLAPCTIVLGISDHEFRDIMDAAIYYMMSETYDKQNKEVSDDAVV